MTRLIVLPTAFFLSGAIIFTMSCPSNFVAKNTLEFSGSLIDNSAHSMVAFLGEQIMKIFFSDFFGFFKLKLFEINLAKTIFFYLSCRSSSSKMDFVLNEAEVEFEEDYKLVFSDDEYEMEDDSTVEEEDSMFIDNSLDEEEDRNFYRDLDNRENYPRFPNQTRNPIEVVN